MRKFMWSIIVLLLAFLVHDQFAIAPAKAPETPTVNMMVLDESLDGYAAAWKIEVARRFPNAEVILCHGGEFVDGQWLVKAPDLNLPAMSADALTARVQAKFPNKVVVLLACNPGHLKLHTKGVYYSPDSVWCVPDRATGNDVMADRMTFTKREHPATIPTTVPYNDRHASEGPDEDEAAPAHQPSRWQSDPGVVGDIFEFQQAE